MAPRNAHRDSFRSSSRSSSRSMSRSVASSTHRNARYPDSLQLVRSSSAIRKLDPRSDARSRIQARLNVRQLTPIEEEEEEEEQRATSTELSIRPSTSRPRTSHSYNQHRHVACGLCKKDHRLLTCSKYTRMNLEEKYDAVMQYHYCINCLARSHLTSKCTSRRKCTICSGKHHSSLHGHPRLCTTRRAIQATSKRQTTTTPYRMALQTLVPTASVRLFHDGVWHSIRALINPTRKNSIIAAETVKKLRFPVTHLDSQQLCKMVVGSRTDESFRLDVHALVSSELPNRPYESDINDEAKKMFEHLVWADPNFTKASRVMMELGADVYPRLIRPGLIAGDHGMAVAQNTALGWTLSGPCGV